MKGDRITYREGYKYQLEGNYALQIGIFPRNDVQTEYIWLSMDGVLTVKDGYAWDGASGPVFQTSNTMRGSLVHDALYQLIREGHLPMAARETADGILREICIEDSGMGFLSRLRFGLWYDMLRLFGRGAALPEAEHLVVTAP